MHLQSFTYILYFKEKQLQVKALKYIYLKGEIAYLSSLLCVLCIYLNDKSLQ